MSYVAALPQSTLVLAQVGAHVVAVHSSAAFS